MREFPTAPKQRVFPKILLPAEHGQADSSYLAQEIRLLASEVLVGLDLTDDLVGFSRFHSFYDRRGYDLVQFSFGFLYVVPTFRCFLNRRSGRMRHVGQIMIFGLIEVTYKQKVNLLLSDAGVDYYYYIPDTERLSGSIDQEPRLATSC